MKKNFNRMKLLISFILVIFYGCSLKPTETKEEPKKYQETIHNVEMANYEFEERLNSFYESEPVDVKDLDKTLQK